ncbi:MAG: hypothetical protein WCF90_08810 [Methanomicrobiales archaeon]
MSISADDGSPLANEMMKGLFDMENSSERDETAARLILSAK